MHLHVPDIFSPEDAPHLDFT